LPLDVSASNKRADPRRQRVARTKPGYKIWIGPACFHVEPSRGGGISAVFRERNAECVLVGLRRTARRIKAANAAETGQLEREIERIYAEGEAGNIDLQPFFNSGQYAQDAE